MVAGTAGEFVEAFAFASEDDDGAGVPVIGVVVDGASLVEADAPDVVLLELLDGADQIDDASDADVLGCAGGGFDGHGAQGGGASLGKDDAIDACAVGGSQECAEVLGIFDPVEGEQEAGGGIAGFGDEVFQGEEFAFAHDGNDALVGGGFGHAGELVSIFKTNTNALGSAEIDDALQLLSGAVLLALAADADMIETAIAGPQSFFYRVQPE